MFAPRYFPRTYFAGRYWAPNEFDPNQLFANLEGIGYITGNLTEGDTAVFKVSGRSTQMLFRALGLSFDTKTQRRTN